MDINNNNDNKKIFKNLSFNYYCKNTLKEINSFEPAFVSRDITNISLEKFNYIKSYSECIKNGICNFNINFNTNSNRPIPLMNIYSGVLRYINSLKKGEHLKNQICIDTSNEWQLLIVLSADSNLEYYNLYLKKQEEGLSKDEINEYLIKYYGFYSYKLLFMEMKTSELVHKLTEMQNNSKSK